MILLNMKKTILFLALASLTLTSCRKDAEEVQQETDIATQNTYDDQAAQKYLQTHYFDAKGNVKELKENDTVHVKLSDLGPVTLPSGVIYVKRPDAQPENGTPVGNSDIISIMHNTVTYIAGSYDGKVSFSSPFTFRNTIAGSGLPEVDPMYYYVKNSTLNAATADVAKQRNFYEIEGFKEALQHFEAFDLPVESNYNLQGLIIVPSRAAFGRDPHYNYSNIAFRNRTFVFNFQLYKSESAPDPR